MEDRRNVHRGRTYLGGQIAFNQRMSTFDCLVRNMSQNGAKICFQSTVGVPGEFDITIQQKGESRRAKIIWRNEVEAGIVFLEPLGAAVVSIESARRIKQLEADRGPWPVASRSQPA